MEEESPKKPSIRRRITPIYTLQEEEFKVKVRDPFTALKEEDEKLKKLKVESTTVPLKVKEVLKETTERKVSLSEVLQQKNLSLSELLKGDPAVLSALIENSNNINRNFETSDESVEMADVQKIASSTTERTEENTIATKIQLVNENPVLVRRKEIITNRMSLKPKLRVPVSDLNKNKTADGPIRVTIDLESTLTNSESLPEKLKNATAKEELMEILKDPVESDRLAQILASRNMTLEELIQQRERGASKLHLSDIFHNEKREPEPQEKPLIGKIIAFPTVKVIPLPELPTKARSLDFVPQPMYTVTSFPTYKIEMPKPDQPQFFPVHESDSETTTYYSTDFNDIQLIEDVENRIAEAVNEQFNVEQLEENTSIIHSGVKSAILASAIIVGASLSVFLTIFVVFKWTQKQKKRLNYCDSFTRIRAPILETQANKRSLRTFMTETLGRNKMFYQQNLQQSMSDVSWDSDRK